MKPRNGYIWQVCVLTMHLYIISSMHAPKEDKTTQYTCTATTISMACCDDDSRTAILPQIKYTTLIYDIYSYYILKYYTLRIALKQRIQAAMHGH